MCRGTGTRGSADTTGLQSFFTKIDKHTGSPRLRLMDSQGGQLAEPCRATERGWASPPWTPGLPRFVGKKPVQMLSQAHRGTWYQVQ